MRLRVIEGVSSAVACSTLRAGGVPVFREQLSGVTAAARFSFSLRLRAGMIKRAQEADQHDEKPDLEVHFSTHDGSPGVMC
jgi:hypothetical protein